MESTVTEYGLDYVRTVLGIYEATDCWLDTLAFHVQDDGVEFSALCTDMFEWGITDTERILASDLELLRQTAEDLGEHSGDYLSDLFTARKRAQRPSGVYYRNLSPEVAALFNAAGPGQPES